MSKKAFDKIAGGLKEAIAVARGETSAKMHVPPEIDVKGIRKKLDLTQDQFAQLFGFTASQIREWEQGRNRPLGALRTYLLLIKSDPESIAQMISETRQKFYKSTKAA